MKTNSKELMEALPDFDKILDLIKEIRNLSYEKMVLESTIKQAEAATFHKVMTDPNLFVNGRTVSVSYFENAYKQSGFQGEITALRVELASIVSELDMKRNQLDVYKQMHEMWRTMVYSEKAMS